MEGTFGKLLHCGLISYRECGHPLLILVWVAMLEQERKIFCRVFLFDVLLSLLACYKLHEETTIYFVEVSEERPVLGGQLLVCDVRDKLLNAVRRLGRRA
jgi:hypothetical protein